VRKGFRPQRLIPLPLVECQRLLEAPVRDAGYELASLSSRFRPSRMTASRGGERWVITFQPHSVFRHGNRCRVPTRRSSRRGSTVGLWKLPGAPIQRVFRIGRRRHAPGPRQRCPPSLDASCASKETGTDGRSSSPASSSIPKGLILTTAHDLRLHQSLTCGSPEGKSSRDRLLESRPRWIWP